MSTVHRVAMTHKRCDLILEALNDVIATIADQERAEELQAIADDLLLKFDSDHRTERLTPRRTE